MLIVFAAILVFFGLRAWVFSCAFVRMSSTFIGLLGRGSACGACSACCTHQTVDRGHRMNLSEAFIPDVECAELGLAVVMRSTSGSWVGRCCAGTPSVLLWEKMRNEHNWRNQTYASRCDDRECCLMSKLRGSTTGTGARANDPWAVADVVACCGLKSCLS